MAVLPFPPNSWFLLDKLCDRISEAVDHSGDFSHEQPVATSATPEPTPSVEACSEPVKSWLGKINSVEVPRLPGAAQLPPIPGLPPADACTDGSKPRLAMDAYFERVEILLRQLRYTAKVRRLFRAARLSPAPALPPGGVCTDSAPLDFQPSQAAE